MVFEDCKIYGAGVHTFGSPDSSLSTTFIRCHFEDKPWTDGRVYGRHLYEADGPTENARWEDCTFVANEVRSLWIGENHVKKYLINCTITHRSTQIPDDAFQAVLRGVVLERCTFKEDFPDGGSPVPYYINVENVEVRGETIVEGPDVSFFKRMPAGALGVLEERLWNPISTN